MILQISTETDYFLITLLLSPFVIFLTIKLMLNIFNKSHLNKGIVVNLLHFAFAIIIASILFYAYDSFGVYLAEKYDNNRYTFFSSSEVNRNNYKDFSWNRKLFSHDGFYLIDENLTFQKGGTIRLFITGISADNWFVLKYIFNLNDEEGSNTYNPIYDSVYVSSEHNLFSDTVYFYYNDYNVPQKLDNNLRWENLKL